MTKKEYIEQAGKAAGLQYDLFQKFPRYVTMDLALSTDSQGEHRGKQRARYNIYTPEINHNNYGDFNDFIRYMERLLSDGVIEVRMKMLQDRLSAAQETRVNAIDEIDDLKKDIEKLQGM